MRRLPLVPLALLLALLLAACPDGDDGDTAGDGTAVTTSTTDDEAGTTTTEAGDTTTTTEPCPPLPGGTTESTTGEPEDAPVFLGDVQLTADRCTATVTFELEGTDGEPGWQIEYAEPPFRGPDNEPVEVEGDAFLRVVLQNVSGVDLSGEQPRETYTGPDEVAGEGFVAEVQQVSDFEAVVEWVVGLDRRRPYEVEGGADRVVVTIGSRG